MRKKNLPLEEEFVKALEEKAALYGVPLDVTSLSLLTMYFKTVSIWNARLHLVAPCAPAEFATRHVLESLLAARFLKEGARVVDIGSGAGLPVIPCLILRPDIEAVLIEASAKKSVFLREALRALGRHERARVKAARFESLPPPEADALTCRALERFTEMLPVMLEWSANVGTLLLFGGASLREQLETAKLDFDSLLIPESERRFLFVV